MEARQTKVLVVDDDALVRKSVRLTCETEGYLVTEVGAGQRMRFPPSSRCVPTSCCST